MYQNFIYRDVNVALLDLMQHVLDGPENGSRNGTVKEITHTGITLLDPTQRETLIGERNVNIAAQIAEAMWVLAGRNDIEFLEHYLPRARDFSDDGKTWRAGYGPRLRSWMSHHPTNPGPSPIDQLEYVIETLRADPLSRQAVISLWDPAVDTTPGKDRACNNWLTFTSRLGKLDLHVGIRSNDLMWGWSGINAFEWSVLQEIVAEMLGIQVGALHFSVTSLHLYAPYWAKASRIASQKETWKDEICALQESPRFDSSAVRFDSVEGIDLLLDRWFTIEREIREGDRAAIAIDVEEFPEPMMRSWLRILQWWWTGDHGYLKPLAGTRLEYATHVAVQPPQRVHWSDCATHNAPALPVGPCNCGKDNADTREEDKIKAGKIEALRLAREAISKGRANTVSSVLESIRPNLKRVPQLEGEELPIFIEKMGQRLNSEVEDVDSESNFLHYAIATHNEKHLAYGDSWKRRGEMLGIMANIARKVDRLGGAETSDETSADTAMDLMIYLAKYRVWIWDQNNGTNQSDTTDKANSLLRVVESASERQKLVQPGVPDQERRLREEFDGLESAVTDKRNNVRAETVDRMLAHAYELARYLWETSQHTDPMAENGDYRGADQD